MAAAPVTPSSQGFNGYLTSIGSPYAAFTGALTGGGNTYAVGNGINPNAFSNYVNNNSVNGLSAGDTGAGPALLGNVNALYQNYLNGGSGGGSTTGGSTASAGTLSPAEINAALAQIVAQQQTEQNQYDAAKTSNAGSDTQQAANEQLDVQNNTGARANAIQNAEQAAASGNQGLKAVLASLGALGGTGQILAGRAVADSANNNIGSADSTYATNAQKIAEANDAYLTAKGQRDQTLDTALQTDKQSTANSIYQNLINKAQNIGDTATANEYLTKLTGSETPITPINAAQVLYNGANTAAYAPSSSVNVTSAPTQAGTAASQTAATNAVTPVNSALYVNKTR